MAVSVSFVLTCMCVCFCFAVFLCFLSLVCVCDFILFFFLEAKMHTARSQGLNSCKEL